MEKIRIGISKCLLGENVRYDGGHKLDRFLKDTLGRFVDYVPVCPEVECGLGIPRESMRLVGEPENPRLVTNRTAVDHTERMLAWARQRLARLAEEPLCGFIFKSDSPSSGMERVKVYPENGIPVKKGVGIFAREFMASFPLVPVEEEGRLHDPVLRENFIERIFAMKRWRETVWEGKKPGALVDFHTRNKLLILSHSPSHYKAMGVLVAHGERMPLRERMNQYQVLLVEALQLKATPRKNANVLQHMMGYFKTDLSPDEKREMLEIIEWYRKEILPLIVPVTLIGHYVRKYDQPYLKGQTYLNPHPMELQLRNHA